MINDELISRKAVIDRLQKAQNVFLKHSPLEACGICYAREIIASEVEIPTIEKRPQDKWIPIKYRPLTSEERKKFAEHYGIEYCDILDEKAFDCPMPEDGQEILISTKYGVDIDVADNDIDGEGFICYGLEGNGDWDSVIAWQPLPEPYKKGEEE